MACPLGIADPCGHVFPEEVARAVKRCRQSGGICIRDGDEGDKTLVDEWLQYLCEVVRAAVIVQDEVVDAEQTVPGEPFEEVLGLVVDETGEDPGVAGGFGGGEKGGGAGARKKEVGG